MTPIKLATVGIIAAGAMFGALTASAAPISSLGSIAQNDSSMVEQVGYPIAVGGPMATATARGPIIAPTIAIAITATITSDLIGGLEGLRDKQTPGSAPGVCVSSDEN